MTVEQPRRQDGSAGMLITASSGRRMSDYRRPDSRIAQAVWMRSAMRDRCSTSAQEPGTTSPSTATTAVEPSASMRPASGLLRPAIDAVAESLPSRPQFRCGDDDFSVHQWGSHRGLMETVAPPAVLSILTCDPDLLDRLVC